MFSNLTQKDVISSVFKVLETISKLTYFIILHTEKIVLLQQQN